jgi:group II intron reverse transcriptase/maturase
VRQLASLALFDRITHHEHLLEAYEALRQTGGRAPGVDGVSFGDLGRRDVAQLLRELSGRLRAGRYRPAPRRRTSIPKADGSGRRTLAIPTLIDRVVSKAIALVLGPLLEPSFSRGSYGFRPGRDTLRLLADLEREMARTRRYVLVSDDIRSAFDRVRIADVLEALREHVPEERLLDLIEVVVRGGGKGRGRALGIAQGDPLSPLCLNVVLHRAHDAPLDRQEDDPPWARYADNLAYLARDVPEGENILEQARQRLSQIDLELKGQDGPPTDLRTSSAKLLGYRLAWRGGRLELGADEAAWRALRRGLEAAHDEPDPGEAAQQVVLGWAAAFGPALAQNRWPSSRTRLVQALTSAGFREVDVGAVERAAHATNDRWEDLRARPERREVEGLRMFRGYGTSGRHAQQDRDRRNA